MHLLVTSSLHFYFPCLFLTCCHIGSKNLFNLRLCADSLNFRKLCNFPIYSQLNCVIILRQLLLFSVFAFRIFLRSINFQAQPNTNSFEQQLILHCGGQQIMIAIRTMSARSSSVLFCTQFNCWMLTTLSYSEIVPQI